MLFRYLLFNVCLTATVLIFSLAVGINLGFTLPPLSAFTFPAFITFVCVVTALIFHFVRRNDNIVHTSLGFATVVLFMLPGGMFSYITVLINGLNIDQALTSFDNVLGVNWVNITHVAAQYPNAMSWAAQIYISSLYICAASLFVFGMVLEKPERVHEFVTNVIFGGLFCSLIGGIFPADGYYVFSNISQSVIASINPSVGPSDMAKINEIRNGELATLYIEGGLGVVSFPSFHTVLSLILVWMARGTGFFFVVSVIWNVGIILCTPIMGNHYIGDVVGGAVLSVFIIWLTSRIYESLNSNDLALANIKNT